jgi:hypothetical protein
MRFIRAPFDLLLAAQDHARGDERYHARANVATALQSVVQTLGKPWFKRRALRVFRDDTSLSATPHLWP